LGQLSLVARPNITIRKDGNVLYVERVDETRQSRSLHGLTRTLVANMCEGVYKGFVKNLELVGVGYRGQVNGTKLVLQLGYSHPVELDIPEGLTVAVEQNTKVSVKGANKQTVGDFSALIRSKRPPEPYKGKGVRYAGEVLRRKAGKSGKK
jgi:large subunit ribosomal protein L6